MRKIGNERKRYSYPKNVWKEGTEKIYGRKEVKDLWRRSWCHIMGVEEGYGWDTWQGRRTKQVLTWRISGRRGRRKPQMKWLQTVEWNLMLIVICEWRKSTIDKQGWKKICIQAIDYLGSLWWFYIIYFLCDFHFLVFFLFLFLRLFTVCFHFSILRREFQLSYLREQITKLLYCTLVFFFWCSFSMSSKICFSLYTSPIRFCFLFFLSFNYFFLFSRFHQSKATKSKENTLWYKQLSSWYL